MKKRNNYGKWIFIYKGKINNTCFSYYALYSTVYQDLTINDSGFTLLIDSVVPSTKEQRDTLLKTMDNAGYTFDFDKKELKKIVNPTSWSEEDDKHLQIAINYTFSGGYLSTVDWLKSLKDRVQPKQEWRKEDENKLNEIIGYLNAFFYNYSIGLQKFNDYKTWLKSLRLRSQWKPSDEQLNNILDVLSFDNCTLKRRELLESLYNDLKKLKG